MVLLFSFYYLDLNIEVEMDNQINSDSKTPEIISIWEWIITIFITMIPVAGQVMLLIWAFGSGVNPSKANWARANQIWFVVALFLFTLFVAIFGLAALSFMNS